MSQAVVSCEYAPVFAEATESALRLDEVLMGMQIEIEEIQDPWCRVATPWGSNGFIRIDNLQTEEEIVAQWGLYAKMVARSPYVDVLKEPNRQAPVMASVPKGGVLHAKGPKDEGGYIPVELPGGLQGFAKGSNLMPQLLHRSVGEHVRIREALAATALSYLGTQFRQGGRTTSGMDDKGLALMTYLFNGISLPQGCATDAVGPLFPVDIQALGMGDIVFFNEHVGVYLGEGNYIHATDDPGSDGVVINSMQPDSPFYVGDLTGCVERCGSLFKQ